MKSAHRVEAVVIAVLFVVIGLILLVGKAAAAERPVPTLSDDMQVARDYWGWQHSPYCTSEVYEESMIFWGGEAESTKDALHPEACSIRVITIKQLEERISYLHPGEPGYVPNATEYAPRARELRCRVMVHEYGHWLGLGHVQDINNPMYWKVTFTPVIPGCEARMHEGSVEGTPRRHRRRHPARVSALRA